jgi:Aerotolerance regulator N-terminal
VFQQLKIHNVKLLHTLQNMQFVFPLFLTALAAIAIPVIIHLFHFRRFKTVYFTNVRFLKEVKEETSARSKLRNLLVLLARALAIGAMVLAFAQPFIPKAGVVKKGDQSVSVFIDNSFSMSALSKDVSLLEKAKQRGREIVAAYANTDRFQILTNDFEGRHQRLVGKEDALRFIDEIKSSPAVREMSKVLMRQTQALSSSKSQHQTAFVVSDFQKNGCDFSNFKDSATEIHLVPLEAVQEKNIAIDSAWFEAPVQIMNQTNALVVKITNFTNENIENVKLTLQYDGQSKPVGTFNIPAMSSTKDTVNITILRTGWHEAVLEITDYPIQFDDKYYFAFNVPSFINILTINENAPNRYLDAALAGNRLFRVMNQNVNGLEYSKFATYQMIVLNGLSNISSGLASELGNYMKNGGNVITFPAPNAHLNSYTGFLNGVNANILETFENNVREVSQMNTEEFIFKDVYLQKSPNMKLPVTQGNFGLRNRSGENLLSYRDGTHFFTKNKVGNGHLYLCAAPLDDKYNDLARNGEVFVPMLYKTAISAAKDNKLAYMIGKDDYIEADSKGIVGETAFKLKGRAEEFIPEQRIAASKALLGVKEGVKEAGFYNLYVKPDSILHKYAFNFDRRESSLEYFGHADLKQFIRKNLQIMDGTADSNLTSIVGERNQGIILWRWCIIAALLFLAIETALLRFWKV